MKKIISLIYVGFLLTFFLAPAAVNAGMCNFGNAVLAPTVCTKDLDCTTMSGVPTDKCDLSASPTANNGTPSQTTASATSSLTNPLAGVCKDKQGTACVQLVLGSVIKTALGVVGSIALLMAVWGGFLWLTSMGNESKVEQGKKTLIWSILGLVLIFGAYALTTFVFSAIAPGK